MDKVLVRNGDVDGALRNMRRKNAREPGVRRREKKAEGIKNTRKRERNRY